MSIMDMDAMMDGMYTQMEGMFQGLSTEFGVKPDEKELFDKHYSKMVSLMKTEMNWAKLKEPMIELYVNAFSDAEIDGMLTFYKSDIGQSTLTKLPVVMQQSMQISQSLVKDLMPKIQALSKELRAELQEKRVDK
jgi:hypothetical protein